MKHYTSWARIGNRSDQFFSECLRCVQRRKVHLEMCGAIQVQEKALDGCPTPVYWFPNELSEGQLHRHLKLARGGRPVRTRQG